MQASDQDLLFFTCANRKYESFVPLYACSVLHHVADATLEVCVENGAAFALRNVAALAILDAYFPGRLLVREASFKKKPPGTVRFVTPPHTSARWVYIGDIDILVLERDVLEQHLAIMKQTGLPYSNSVRQGDRSRLTGLHFTSTEAYYPLPALKDLDLRKFLDEQILLEIVKRKGLPVIEDRALPRPEHGIHMSQARPVVAEEGDMDRKGNRMTDWRLDGRREAYEAFRGCAAFRDLRPHLRELARESIEKIDEAYGAELVREARSQVAARGFNGLSEPIS